MGDICAHWHVCTYGNDNGHRLPYTKKSRSLTLLLDSVVPSALESWIGKKRAGSGVLPLTIHMEGVVLVGALYHPYVELLVIELVVVTV